jgi:hypothetical protein
MYLNNRRIDSIIFVAVAMCACLIIIILWRFNNTIIRTCFSVEDVLNDL